MVTKLETQQVPDDITTETPADDIEAEEAMEGEYFADEDPDQQPPFPEEIPETCCPLEGLTSEQVADLVVARRIADIEASSLFSL